MSKKMPKHSGKKLQKSHLGSSLCLPSSTVRINHNYQCMTVIFSPTSDFIRRKETSNLQPYLISSKKLFNLDYFLVY